MVNGVNLAPRRTPTVLWFVQELNQVVQNFLHPQ